MFSKLHDVFAFEKNTVTYILIEYTEVVWTIPSQYFG